MGVFVLAAITFRTVTVQIQTVVGQADAVTGRDFTLARFDRVITEFDHFAAVEADQVIVVMLLSQFENGFTAFKIMTSHDTGVIKLVEDAVNGRQTNLLAHVDQAFI